MTGDSDVLRRIANDDEQRERTFVGSKRKRAGPLFYGHEVREILRRVANEIDKPRPTGHWLGLETKT